MNLHLRNLPDIAREKELPEQSGHTGQVHIWAHSLHSGDQFLGEAPYLLSQDELSRAAKYHFEKDRKVYESGHVFIRKILSHYTDEDATSLQLTPVVNQKPSLLNAPFPLHFNISHSGSKIIVAVGFDNEVGIDVEKIIPDFDTDGFAEANYHLNEINHLKKLSDKEDTDYFYTIWTRKEAWLKLTGEGVNDKLRELDFSGDGKNVTKHSFHKNLYMTSWKETTEYIATLALFHNPVKIKFFGSELLESSINND